MNIYLITCAFSRLVNCELKKILGNNEYLFLNMNRNNFNEFFEECGYSFFLDDMKYIVVKNMLNNLDASQEDKLIKYFSKPNEKVTVIFLEEKVDARKKLIKSIKKNYSFINVEVDYKNIYGIVNDYIKDCGYKYDYELTKFLVNTYSSNIDLIFNELDKVFLYYDKEVVLSIRSVFDIISTPINTNSFKFVEAVVNKDLALSQNYLSDLLTCKTEITSLIILLAREYRLISYVKTYYKRHLGIKEMAAKLKLLDWQVEKHYKNSLSYTDSELKFIIKMLGEYDEQIKTGRLEKNSAIQLTLLNIIV